MTLSGAQRPRRRGGARQHVAQQRSAALGGARLPSAALGGAQRPRQHGGARQHVAARIVALGNDRFGTCSGARTPALGGVPLHSAEVRRRLGRRRWLATRPLRRRLLGAGLGRRQVAGRPYFLRGPRVRSHARSSGPFPSRFSGPRPQWQTLMPFTRRFSGPLPQLQTDVMQAVLGSAPMHGFQCSDPRSRVETILLPHTRSRGASARSLIGERWVYM